MIGELVKPEMKELALASGSYQRRQDCLANGWQQTHCYSCVWLLSVDVLLVN